MPWEDSCLSKLEKFIGTKLPMMRKCYHTSENELKKLNQAIGSGIPAEASFVAFGSLARKEYTSGSDLDWSLIVDGRAAANHREVALELVSKIKKYGFNSPSPTGPFGNLIFSHELIHHIGGSADTNANLTRRLLLLLESTETGERNLSPRRLVMRGILQRYFEEEANFPKTHFFPRFFLNDIIRLWRTLAVDYAAKNSERRNEKWALRNAKLRFSRKLLYVAGLLLAYETTLFPKSDLISGKTNRFDSKNPQLSSAEHCFQAAQLTPLELLARACLKLRLDKKDVRIVFGAYDNFLKLMDSKDKREKLSKLVYKDAMRDKCFQDMRDLGHEFQDGLQNIFINSKTPLAKLTLKYVTF